MNPQVLKLLNINKEIEKGKLLEVENSRLPERNAFVTGSLWDPNIFGSSGTKERREKFGYIDLRNNYIHPAVFKLVQTCAPEVSQIINNKGTFIVKDGKYVSDELGETGVPFLIKTFRDVDFRTFCKKDKVDDAKFIEKNKDLIIIDKFLVSPPAPIRDIDLFKGASSKTTSELNEFYSKMIYYKNTMIGDEMLDSAIISRMQSTINGLYAFVINSNFKGKGGMFRGKIMKKTMDFSTRLVLTSSPQIPFGSIGLPYTTLICVYEPLFTFYKKSHPEIDEGIKEYLGKGPDEELQFNEYTNFVYNTLTKYPDTIKGDFKELLFNSITDILKDQIVIFKRDPVVQRNSWSAAYPIAQKDAQAAIVNSLDLPPMGGDCDGDTIEILPLFSEESKKEAAEKMCNKNSKSKYFNVISSSKLTYAVELDNVATIFAATRK